MRKQSVLCVEPDRESQELLGEVLRDFGPVFASNAYEALHELDSGLFDAYLLEAWLPDFSGPALCREIHRTDPRGPVIFCTGAVRNQDRLLALRAGANAFLCKPLDPAELLRQIRVLFELTEFERSAAAVAATRATADELARHRTAIVTGAGAARQATLRTVERICKSKAFSPYAGAGGTRANFERSWHGLFETAAAAYEEASPANMPSTTKAATEKHA
jgi:DNA-binding response OmpR family regulator